MDKDNRSISQIGDAIMRAASNLNLGSRLALARRMNMFFNLSIPLSQDDLVDDNFWLDQVQEVIKSIPEYAGNDEGATRSILLNFEFVVRMDRQEV